MIILLCDDNNNHLNKLEVQVRAAMEPGDELFLYTNGLDLLDDVENATALYDLIFLDIRLPGIDGLKIADELSTLYKQSRRVCFITNYSEEYALPAYSLLPFTLLEKPLNQEMIDYVIKDVRANLPSCDLTIKNRTKIIRVPLSHINYIESFGRMLLVHTDYETYSYYYKISQLEKELVNNDFFRLDRSHIVNLKKIKEIGVDTITLRGGQVFYFAVRRREELSKAVTAIKNKW